MDSREGLWKLAPSPWVRMTQRYAMVVKKCECAKGVIL